MQNKRRGTFSISALAWSVALLMAFTDRASAETPPDEVRFNRDIRPIMSDTCFKCHGPAEQQAGLRLDKREAALAPAESGAIPIVPGKPDDSEIIRRVFSTDAALRMPPADSHKSLTPNQQQLFRRWVAQGAVYEQHWSFEPLTAAAPPQAVELAKANNPIDLFIADRLRRDGLAMSEEAEREILIRRVAFALTGLPPSLPEVDAYLADTSPDAYANMVDRYLGSQQFGEEQARHWLDVARYADTHGLHLDNERQMWAYRDYVVKSFNQNKPFDQFTVEQLAGDLLPDPSLDQLVATGFIRCNVTTGEGGSINEEWIFRNAVDRASTTAEAWLGLTAGCAVCHDHKFDPLSAKDFYSFYAFFHSAADPPLDGNVLLTAPTTKLATAEHVARLAEFDQQIAGKQQQLDAQTAAVAYSDPATLDPPPPVSAIDDVWFDDAFPEGGKAAASPGHPTLFVTAANGQVFHGEKALKRTDKGLTQDVYEGQRPLAIPNEGRLYAHVWIDPQDPPKTLMLQYFKSGWLHRAVWGDYDAIEWGARDTTERVLIGPLPKAGEWVRLQAAASKIGLRPGDAVTGFAFTQFGGTVYWDQAGVEGINNPATDPRRSLRAYWKQQAGKDTAGAPADLNQALKAGPEPAPAADTAAKVRNYYLQQVCQQTASQLAPLVQELAGLRQQRDDFDKSIPSSFIYRDLPQPRESFVMLRGQYNKPGEPVQPGVPAILPPLALSADSQRANRLDLARWLVSPENPLTARVTVNRFWQQMFGVGLVKTSFDFGSQGETPSHPELLDWLAVEFRESGWNVKSLLRLMVMSAAFRQSSAVTPEQWQHDPQNRLYARGPRIRLDAEQLRDNALFVSGLLNPAMGGRGVHPYQPPNIWEPVGFTGSNTANYKQDTGAALYRRSIYVFFKRTAPPPFMVNFDAPNREQFCTVRERSNTPLQALQLMNDVQHFEAARALAERMMAQVGLSPAERIALGYRLVLSRQPSAEEASVVQALFAAELAKYQQHPEAAAKVIRNGESAPKPELPEAELAASTLVANLLLNLDETVTRN
ncbi:MAG: PSD1 and planctomycete cytochrome C domain-containing protein [Pirellulales bacterium]